ncbi:HDIG domain-containing protein [Ectothiorhodospira mobilis]|uniref:HDIG domain-containing protein n=1 Tax=Ectothiorhodospira mobilis TaxID=195064 RepID=A0A1I4PB00_ECTMO|nr:HDOD domain-containing protein [Ectothiorhodospira mobilis]SFM24533.1 HDIG domain-containing protein [Ectothiorhodospira mobilis]
MSLTIEQMVDQATGLVSLPAVAVRLNAMVEDPEATVADIGRLISQDPALTIRLLQVANSPFYGLSHRVDTISRAVNVIGIRQIRDLVLATTVAKAFEGIPNELMSMEDFWRHSIYCGLVARLLAEDTGLRETESVFIGGLLHDIGRLLIFNREPHEAHQAFLLGIAKGGGMPPQRAEREVLGYDHAQVGGALAGHWNLPDNLIHCIRYHHEPMATPEYAQEVALVHIANTVAHMAELDTRDPEDAPPIELGVWERAGLEPSILRSLIERAQQQVVEVEALILDRE